MERIGSLGHGVKIFGYPCEKETKLNSLPHTEQKSFPCVVKDYLYDSGEGNDFLKQDIRTKNHKEKN